MNSSLRVWRVDIYLKPSRIFLFLILALHLAAIVALMQTGLPWYWRLPIFFLLLLNGVVSWRQEKRVGHLLVRVQSTNWWLETPQQQAQASLQHAQVWRHLVVMDFLCRHDHKRWRQRVVVFPDSLSADSFRRLRVRLRYGPQVQESDVL